MGYTINVDVGGTFMDFFVNKGTEYILTKTPTTHYELKVGFMKGLEECAEHLNLDVTGFLGQTDVIKYSTTIGTNALIERNGPKLGLITTRGFEDTIFIGRGRQWADGLPASDVQNIGRVDKPEPLIPRSLVVGVSERVDYKGQEVMPISRDEVLEHVQYLVDHGVRGFVVSLLWSFMNPTHEQQIKEIIEEEYPEIYLGNMPVILSSEISPKEGEYVRTMSAIVNAYMHVQFVEQLSILTSSLIDSGYKKPLLLVDNLGGCAKAVRTIAASTHNSSPVAGLVGAGFAGNRFGLPNIVYTDVGGTSFDIGVIAEGNIKYYDLYPTIDRWRTQITTIKTSSIGTGGGSIAWLNPILGNRLEVGPKSAGSMPGPACYDLGGEDATVSDADVVLGYLNPDYYLGGRFTLNREKAFGAMRKIGDQAGWDEVTTATMIKKVADAKMGQEVFKEVAFKGYEPSEFVIFACGGAGATHCCGVANAADIRICYIPIAGSVFGAFGASSLDIVHKYEKSNHIRLFDYSREAYAMEFESFNRSVDELRSQALKDIVLEGFTEEDAEFKLELEMRYGAQWRYTNIESPLQEINSENDIRKICDYFTEEFSKMNSEEAAYPEAGIEVETFRLFVTCKLPHFFSDKSEIVSETPDTKALKEKRDCYWQQYQSFKKTPVYELSLLKPGNKIAGPIIVEDVTTTIVVEPNWSFYFDVYGNGILTNEQTTTKTGD